MVRSSAVSLIVSYTILEALSILAVGLRFVSINVRKRAIKHHDWLCLLSLICLTAYFIDTIIGSTAGNISEHITEASLDPGAVIIALKTFWASEFFWATSICAFRISILLLYIEIFAKPIVRIPAYISIGFVTAFWVGSIVTTLADCRPIAFNWNKTIKDGKCGNIGTGELAVAAINMVFDIVIVSLPLPVVWNLQMPMNKKVAVSVTFALGLSIAAINIARIVKVLDCPLADFTYCTRDSAILTVAEMAAGIIVACVPTFGGVVFSRRLGATWQVKYAGTKSSGNSESSKARLHDPNLSYNTRDFQRIDNDAELDDPVYRSYVLNDQKPPLRSAEEGRQGAR